MVAKLFVYVKGLNYFLTLLPPFPSTHPFVRKISILINFLCFFHSEDKCNQSDSVINLSSL